MLLHAGGRSRQEWHAAGYVRRLQDDFTVITLDLRGYGENGLPTDPADYTIYKMMQDARDFCAHWPPIIQAQRAGTLDIDTLSEHDQEFLHHFHLPVMLDWPAVEPGDFRCPTLWLIGSQDRQAMDSLKEYEETLPESLVKVHIFEELDHIHVFTEIDKVLPTMLAFTHS